MKMQALTREEDIQISDAFRSLDEKMLDPTVDDYPHNGVSTSPIDVFKEIAACRLPGLAMLELKNTERKSQSVFGAVRNLKRIGCDPDVVNTFLVRLAIEAKSESEMALGRMQEAVTAATSSKTPGEFMKRASMQKDAPKLSEMKVQRDPLL